MDQAQHYHWSASSQGLHSAHGVSAGVSAWCERWSCKQHCHRARCRTAAAAALQGAAVQKQYSSSSSCCCLQQCGPQTCSQSTAPLQRSVLSPGFEQRLAVTLVLPWSISCSCTHEGQRAGWLLQRDAQPGRAIFCLAATPSCLEALLSQPCCPTGCDKHLRALARLRALQGCVRLGLHPACIECS